MSRLLAFGMAALLLSACGIGQSVGSGDLQPTLERVRLVAGKASIDVEVARTPGQIQRGLMHRPSLLEGRGMLFVFAEPGRQCFWMKNTLVPLTAAFLDADGRILNLADMQPRSERLHCSDGDALYVLEAPQGWFQRQGMGAGDRIVAAQRVL